jgi:hypothetical protein
VAELVEENDDRQDEQEGDDIPDEHMAQVIETMQEKLSHSNPLKPEPKGPAPTL